MNWDNYFLDICKVVASNSKCHSRKIGAILVRDKVIICAGYNGPPRGFPHCEADRAPCLQCHGTGKLHNGDLVDTLICHYCGGSGWYKSCHRRSLGFASGKGLHLCPAAHAERNAIDQAARLGIRTDGATIYMSCPVPCKYCLITLIQAGIAEIVCTNTGELYDLMSGHLIEHSSIPVREFVREEYGNSRD